ncbi:MAG: IS21-like element helper ATPase IstB [Deltaproteobacteria bacterium]|nr:IS21-like element helper ATPase IstB [Deltaproteobacteria bacterium]
MDQKILDQTLINIKRYLEILKLRQIEKNIDEVLAHAAVEKLSTSCVLEKLFEIEANALIERRIERRIKESKLPERKLLNDFDFDFQKGIDKGQIMELATLSFVERNQGLIMAGSSGTGKSHITKALLLIGCQRQYKCRYTTAAQMLKDLMAGLSDDTLDDKLKIYSRPDILLIDEVGFDRLEQESARNASLFFKVIDARYCKGSTLMTTNIDFKTLGEYLGDPVVTTAIVDRMVHYSIIINVEGPSWRMHKSRQLNKPSGKKLRKK